MNCKQLISHPRFLCSQYGRFPPKLRYYSYVIHNDDRSLIFEPSHVFGDETNSIRLNYWNDIHYALDKYHNGECNDYLDLVVSKNVNVNDEFIILLVSKGFKIRKVNISGCTQISGGAMINICNIDRLVDLNISHLPDLSDEILMTMIPNLKTLENLNLTNCVNITNKSLCLISDQLHSLKALWLSKCKNITHHSVYKVIFNCQSLIELDVSYCENLSFVGIVVNTGSMLQNVTRGLESLDVAGCNLQKESMDWICNALPNLHHINIKGSSTITTSHLIGLIQSIGPQVLSINVQNCKNIQIDVIFWIAKYCHQLVELDVASIDNSHTTSTAKGILSLFLNCKMLNKLNLSHNSSVADDSFLNTNNNNSNITTSTTSTTLQHLILNSCNLTSQGICWICERFPNLITLDLSCNRAVDDNGIFAITTSCPLISELHLFDCLNLTDRAIVNVCYTCHCLKILDIGTSIVNVDAWGTRVRQYTDVILEAVFKYAKQLHTLNLRNQYSIRFHSKWLLKGYGKGFSGNFCLERLDLTGVDEVSNEGLRIVLSKCYSLNEVILPGNSEPLRNKKDIPKIELLRHKKKEQMTPAERLLHAERYDLKTPEFWRDCFRHLPYCTHVNYCGVHPHPLMYVWKYRDAYYSRQILEHMSIWILVRFYRLNKKRRVVFSQSLIYTKRRTFLEMIYQRRHQIEIKSFLEKISAVKIQRCFRSLLLPRTTACVKIQKAFRRHQSKLSINHSIKKISAAVTIQKHARGMILRLSDNHIMTQIYLKLPPFWREVLQSAPDRVYRSKVEVAELQHLQKYTHDLMTHIIDDVTKNQTLAPKFVKHVSQPFDKKPYVSMSDGRKLAYYSDHQGMLNKAGEHSIHTFNMKFWPISQTIHPPDNSTLLHDAMVNGFDVPERAVLRCCEQCNCRMLAMHCKTCRRKYCYYCSLRIHSQPAKRQHNLFLMEPRIVVTKDPSSSLVHHVQMAEQTVLDLEYIVKNLRTVADIKRVEADKKLLKEMQEEEKRRQIALQKALLVEKEKHDVVTKLITHYRMKKAKEIISGKRAQHALEKVKEEEKRIFEKCCIIQRNFRRYSTRKWFMSRGVNFNLKRKNRRRSSLFNNQQRQQQQQSIKARLKRLDSEGNEVEEDNDKITDLSEAELLLRTDYEIQQRRVMERLQLADDLKLKYAIAIELLQTNVSHWLEIDKAIPLETAKLVAARDTRAKRERSLEVELSMGSHTLSLADKERLSTDIRAVHQKVLGAVRRLEDLENTRWWIAQHVRGNYRRLSILKQRFQDTMRRVEWIVIESSTISRITNLMEHFLTKAEETDLLDSAVKWIREYLENAACHQALLDSQQQIMLSEELSRVQNDIDATIQFDMLLGELCLALKSSAQYAAEKTDLDYRVQHSEPGTDAALDLSERAMMLSQKLSLLNTSVIDVIKGVLETKFNEEDEANLDVAGFPTDTPDLPTDQMHMITAELFDLFENENKKRAHYEIMDFVKIFFAQPWVSAQAVDDIKLEEEMRIKGLAEDKVLTQIRVIENSIKQCEERVKEFESQIEDIQAEIEVLSELKEEQPPEVVEKQQNMILVLNVELQRNLINRVTLTQMMSRSGCALPPLQGELAAITKEVEAIRRTVVERAQLRNNLISTFFNIATSLAPALLKQIQSSVEHLVKQTAKVTEMIVLCDVVIRNAGDFRARILTDTLSMDERLAFNRPLYTTATLQQQNILATINPKQTKGAESFITATMESRKIWLEADRIVFQARKESLETEESIISTLKAKLPEYETRLKQFLEAQLQLRRQRSIQLELDTRKVRLNELRAERLKAIEYQKHREKVMKEENEKEKKARERQKAQRSKLAANAKKNMRKAADAYRRLRHANEYQFDPEEERMAGLLRRKTQGGSSQIVGIRKMKLTAGVDETGLFERQNKQLFEKGLPYYRPMDRNIGFDGATFLWMEPSLEAAEHITGIELSHSSPDNKNYKDLRSLGYEPVSHPSLRLVIWTKADPKRDKIIRELLVSYNAKEENKFAIDGLERCIENLAEFGLPDGVLWARKIDRDDIPTSRNIAALTFELKNVRKLRETKPDDPRLAQLEKRVADKLKDALKEEEAAEIQDPVKYAVELMALDEKELQAWMRLYESIDKQRVEKLTLDQITEFIEDYPITDIHSYIWEMLESCDDDGMVEFGDFMRTFGIFCLFGKDELLRFLFTYIDKDGAGQITQDRFVDLINVLHPYDKSRAKRALREMDLRSGRTISFAEFKHNNDSYPGLLHPAFKLQLAMRVKTMGNEWWLRKLNKYNEVRQKMLANRANADEAAGIEMKRIERDEAREKRIKEREEAIKQEPSAIKRVILNARQIADEFS